MKFKRYFDKAEDGHCTATTLEVTPEEVSKIFSAIILTARLGDDEELMKMMDEMVVDTYVQGDRTESNNKELATAIRQEAERILVEAMTEVLEDDIIEELKNPENRKLH